MAKTTDNKLIKKGKPDTAKKNSIWPDEAGSKVKPTFNKKVFDQGLNPMNPLGAPSKTKGMVNESVFKVAPNSIWPN